MKMKKHSVGKYGRRRLAAVLISAVTAVFLAACGRGEESAADSGTAKEFVYVPEYLSIGDGTSRSLGNLTMSGDCLYYSVYSWDEETMQSSNSVRKCPLGEGAGEETLLELSGSRNLNGIAVDGEGNLCLLCSEYPDEPDADGNYNPEITISKYDAGMTQVYEQNITRAVSEAGEDTWTNGFAVDGDGNFYVSTNSAVCLFDPQGESRGFIGLTDGWINSIAPGRDGRMYMLYYDYSSATGGVSFSAIDFQSGKIGDTYGNFPGNNVNRFTVGLEKDFLVDDGSRVYEYDLATQSAEEAFTWLDSDINGTYVTWLGVTQDGEILASVSDWSNGGTEIARLEKTRASELPQKEEIVLGTLYDDQSLQASAVAFNKKSDQYHVTIKTYMDTGNRTENSYDDAVANMNNAIISGTDCPDILDLSQVREDQLAAKGLFEDLYPWLDESGVLGREDFVEGILETFERDGKLYSVPKTFNLNTVVGRTSVVGGEMGWSLYDMIACAKEHPDAQLFDGIQQSTVLYYCMVFNQNYFVDWERAECRFDSDEFKALLEFVGLFPEEIDWNSYDGSGEIARMQSGETLLDMAYISDVNDIQVYPAKFGEDVTFVGYPTTDGTVGCMINSQNRYGIVAKSRHKEAAWAFIENYLTDDDDMFSWGFSTIRDRFEKDMEEATTVEYLLDENGEQVLDENGDPIISGGMSMSQDGWEYTYHVPTQEDVQTVRDLIAASQPLADTDNEILDIITEEAEPYFQGQKSIDDVVNVIQSRAQIYVSENS